MDIRRDSITRIVVGSGDNGIDIKRTVAGKNGGVGVCLVRVVGFASRRNRNNIDIVFHITRHLFYLQ